MAQSVNLNQFKQAHEVGDVDLTFFGGENIMSVLIDPTETATNTYTPGMGVRLLDLGRLAHIERHLPVRCCLRGLRFER